MIPREAVTGMAAVVTMADAGSLPPGNPHTSREAEKGTSTQF
jgi:hypothetical protein